MTFELPPQCDVRGKWPLCEYGIIEKHSIKFIGIQQPFGQYILKMTAKTSYPFIDLKAC